MMMLQQEIKFILFVGLGGFFGSIFRFLSGYLSMGAQQVGIPMNTLFINLLGCLLLGFLLGLEQTKGLRPEYRGLFITGFCGSLTTFSTWSAELYKLQDIRSYGLMTLYGGLSVMGGILLIYIGKYIGTSINGI